MEQCIDPHRLLTALSLCLDFTRAGLGRHHQQVAYIASCLSREMGLEGSQRDLILTAALIHDAGVRTWDEKASLMNLEVEHPWDHCQAGYELVACVDFLRPMAELILYHHDRFEGPNASGLAGRDIPLASRILHLADRVDVLLKPNEHVLEQQDLVSHAISRLSGHTFDPELVDVFMQLARCESFWLDLTTPFLCSRPRGREICTWVECFTERNLLQVAELFASVIDRMSAFTHRHSRGVAHVASCLSGAMGFPRAATTMMQVAGLLHDLGKLSVPKEILEKPGKLTPEEFAVIRQHSYFSYWILKEAGVPDPIPEWAAYHHERLDGAGYPFHHAGDGLSMGARIMSVADVFTALREDRPYRSGMSRSQTEKILLSMVAENALDAAVVNALFDIYEEAADFPQYNIP